MNRIAFAITLLMPLLLVTGPGTARTVPEMRSAKTHVVDFVIEQNGRVLGTPKMTLQENSPAEIRVNGAAGYIFGVTLSRTTIEGRSVAHLATTLSLPDDGVFEQVAAPSLTLPFGGSASIEIGTAAPIRLKAAILGSEA